MAVGLTMHFHSLAGSVLGAAPDPVWFMKLLTIAPHKGAKIRMKVSKSGREAFCDWLRNPQITSSR